jgi:Domain of unknown function (DUF4214)
MHYRSTRLRLVALSLTLASLGLTPNAQAQTIPDERNFPAQYFTKLYTEVLGRAPDQAHWASAKTYFAAAGCNPNSLQAVGTTFLQSAEFSSLGYDNAAKLLVLYRSILNREPDATAHANWLNWLNQGGSFPTAIATFYATPEFQTLSKTICDPKNPGYSFGNLPAIDLPIAGSGFSGSEAALQAELNAATPGTTITLAPQAVVRLSRTLVVPPGVNLMTTGMPLPNRYATMARLVRVGDWSGAMVDLQPGAKAYSLWIDGQRGNLPNRYDRPSINVRMLSGTQTTIAYSRVGNSRGATTIELFGQVTGSPCIQNIVAGNLIEAYSSNHFNGQWADGVSVACENAIIASNTVVDATDVPIILFSVNPLAAQLPQTSQVVSNTIVQAGNSAYGALAMDPFVNAAGGDPAGVASRSFEGAVIRDNLLWTSDRTHFDITLAVGTRAWFGATSYNGLGGAFLNNTTGTLRASAGTGIIVSGMLQTNVDGNALQLRLVKITEPNNRADTFLNRNIVNPIVQLFQRNPPTCTARNIGASVSAGFASGNIQGPYDDRLYSGCIAAGR